MRVLMFGWEFPPHITGGLGTACFGLTKGLVKHGVEVIFVVPKGVRTGTLLSPQEQKSSFSALDTSFRLDNAMLSTVKIDGSFIGQPNGSEKWIIAP